MAQNQSPERLDNLQQTTELLAQIINRGWAVIQGFSNRLTYSNLILYLPGFEL